MSTKKKLALLGSTLFIACCMFSPDPWLGVFAMILFSVVGVPYELSVMDSPHVGEIYGEEE
jgi:hypothetical protein